MEELIMARDVDYALILQVLYSRGYTLASISKVTGTAVSSLSNVKQETKPVPTGWHDGWEGMALQDYYRKALGEAPPYVGDYIELGEYCEENDTAFI
jgi:hypothetical protein